MDLFEHSNTCNIDALVSISFISILGFMYTVDAASSFLTVTK